MKFKIFALILTAFFAASTCSAQAFPKVPKGSYTVNHVAKPFGKKLGSITGIIKHVLPVLEVFPIIFPFISDILKKDHTEEPQES